MHWGIEQHKYGCCKLLPAQKSTLVGPTGVFLVFRAQIKVPIEDMTWHRPLQWFLGVMQTALRVSPLPTPSYNAKTVQTPTHP